MVVTCSLVRLDIQNPRREERLKVRLRGRVKQDRLDGEGTVPRRYEQRGSGTLSREQALQCRITG